MKQKLGAKEKDFALEKVNPAKIDLKAFINTYQGQGHHCEIKHSTAGKGGVLADICYLHKRHILTKLPKMPSQRGARYKTKVLKCLRNNKYCSIPFTHPNLYIFLCFSLLLFAIFFYKLYCNDSRLYRVN